MTPERDHKEPLDNRTRHKILTAYLILLALAAGFIVLVSLADHTSTYDGRDAEWVHKISYYEHERIEDPNAPAGYYDKYIIPLAQKFRGEIRLAYHMVHQETEVYVDGQKVYSIRRNRDNPFGKTMGNAWAIATLYHTEIGKKIEVRLYPDYQGVGRTDPEFYLCDELALYKQELMRALPSLILCVIAFIIGIIYIVISRTDVIGEASGRRELRCLGAFSVLLSIWRFSDLRVTALFLPNATILLSYLTLTSLILMPVPLLMFIRERVHIHSKAFHGLTFGFLVLSYVLLFMQWLNLRDFRENLWIIHAALIAALCVVILAGIRDFRRKRHLISSRISIAIIMGVCFCAAADLSIYYLIDNGSDMIFTLLSVIVYVLATGLTYLYTLRKEAEYDTTTGIFNKNKCRDKIEESGSAPEDTVFMMFDLNGLKATNDAKGHDAGDNLISTFARLLKNIGAEHRGSFVGRYGGDEFIMILQDASGRVGAQRVLDRLQRDTEGCNLADPNLGLSFAYGISLSDDYPDATYEELMKHADMEMYLNKKDYYERSGRDRRGLYHTPVVTAHTPKT